MKKPKRVVLESMEVESLLASCPVTLQARTVDAYRKWTWAVYRAGQRSIQESEILPVRRAAQEAR